MEARKPLILLAIALSAVLCVISFLFRDWMWLVVNAAYIITILYPLRHPVFNYSVTMLTIAAVAPILSLIPVLVDSFLNVAYPSFLDVTAHTYISAAVQSYQCYTVGLMVAVMADRRVGLTMTKSWMAIFAVCFAMTLSAVDMFVVFGDMYAQGYPVFNEDFYDSDRYTNAILMATPIACTAISALAAVLTILLTRGRDKSVFVTIPEATS